MLESHLAEGVRKLWGLFYKSLSQSRGLYLTLEVHRDVQWRAQLRAVVIRFLSPCKKVFKSETEAGKHQEFTEREVYT